MLSTCEIVIVMYYYRKEIFELFTSFQLNVRGANFESFISEREIFVAEETFSIKLLFLEAFKYNIFLLIN